MRKTKYFLKSDILEAVTRSSSTKKVFLKLLQKPPEINPPESFLIKCQDGNLRSSLKKGFSAYVFPVNDEKFWTKRYRKILEIK